VKKIGLILLVFVIMTGFAGCERDTDVSNGSEFPSFTFNIPDEWEGRYEKVTTENRITYYYTGYEVDGEFPQKFFSITVMSQEEFNEESQDELFLGSKLGEKEEYVFVLFTPLDNIIIDEEKTAEYNSLNLSLSEIEERFHLDE